MTNAANDEGRSYPLPAEGEVVVSEAQSNPIRDKSFEFAVEIISLYRGMTKLGEFIVSKQLMRSGTAVGALVEEGIAAESRRDFLHKMSLAHKEARETHYWLRLLVASDLIPRLDLSQYLADADELVSLLTAITRSVKNS